MSDISTALSHHRAGRLMDAQALYRTLLANDPANATALHLLSTIEYQLGQFTSALRMVEDAIQLDPSKAIFRNTRGLVLMAMDRHDDAAQAFNDALLRLPHYADAWSNLGLAKWHLGDSLTARAAFERAIELDPLHQDSLYNLANLLRECGDLESAVPLYEKTVRIAPMRVDARNNFGNALLDLDRPDEAIDIYRSALSIDPSHGESSANLALALARADRVVEAEQHFASIALSGVVDSTWPIRIASICPTVFSTEASISTYLARLESTLDRHRQLGLGWDSSKAFGCTPPFMLAHLGGDGRRIREKYASIFQEPAIQPRTRHRAGLPRIGFVVTHPHEQVFLRCMREVVRRLSPDRLILSICCSHSGKELLYRSIGREDITYITLPNQPGLAGERLRRAECDILYHWEVGTDAFNYLLPFARAAPIQCTSWGIQATSGHPAIDDYLSSHWLESDEADSHYTEQLVRLQSLLSYYPRVAEPFPPPSRDEFELPREATIYACLQRPQKLHPGFDAIIGEILRRDARALVLLMSGSSKRLSAALRSRFESTLPDVCNRIRLQPSLPANLYYRLLSLSDVVLDPRPYGMGSSAYDAFSFNLPIVTWPTGYNAGGYVTACYRALGILDLITHSAETYVDLAVKIGTEREYRESLRMLLARSTPALFNDSAAVWSHQTYFETRHVN